MKAVAVALVTGVFAFASGCAHEYLYMPVGPGTGGPAVRYPIPPTAPQGQLYVTSFGFSDIDLGPGAPERLLHARLAVSNGGAGFWTVDGRAQALLAPGRPPQGPAFLNTDAGTGPIYPVPPGQVRVFDLYYALPAPFDRPLNLSGFELDWRVEVGGEPFEGRTAFQRFEGTPGSYAPYPPYVAVGLGFGVGWWYGPIFPYRHTHPPIIRHYYFPPARAPAGPWRGTPPAAGGMRGTPPTGSGGAWRGTPPAAGTGGLRGTPPAGNSVRASPSPVHSSPARAPSRGGGFHGGGRGR